MVELENMMPSKPQQNADCIAQQLHHEASNYKLQTFDCSQVETTCRVIARAAVLLKVYVRSALHSSPDAVVTLPKALTFAMGTMASLYLSIMVMNTLPLIGSRCPAASAALAYAALKLSSMPITSPVDRISGPSSVSAPAAGLIPSVTICLDRLAVEAQKGWRKTSLPIPPMTSPSVVDSRMDLWVTQASWSNLLDTRLDGS